MDDSTAPAALAELARLVRLASQELDRAIAACIGESSVGRWHVLTAVADGEGRSMSQLAEATLLTGASLTRLIDAMISDNLVHRRVDDADRRRVLVFPTRRGLVSCQVMTKAVHESGLDLLATGAPRLPKALTALVDHLRAAESAHV
ncbi:MarR family transcriptional regulator [Nocardia sp. NBC_01503]|uniref:MarR family winged helix-turn-helix transcriptional regulator n=1 Tax=Nocardia sp. NBC_01503 TaxID=2975997 RepID=UPI002E7AFB60|nr:MarR family transcriptional regulator [Nocardia sp. NBC_01503]WTL29210.1 MarR family transcriptional regulator [Nocardia sp. NBC_01503]